MMQKALPVLLRRYKQMKLWVTASTGLAAQQVDGKTLHSTSGLGRGVSDLQGLIDSMPAVSFVPLMLAVVTLQKAGRNLMHVASCKRETCWCMMWSLW